MEVKHYKGNGVVPPSNPFKYVIWAIFGNADDGPIGDGWNLTREDTWWIRVKWWFRNPFHNFTFYTLGNCHKDITVYGWPSVNVFNPNYGWCFTISTTGRMWYPFISYIGRFKFYIGWRLGNSFGVKLTANSKRDH